MVGDDTCVDNGNCACMDVPMSGVLTGLRAWLLQRVSAVYLLLFVVLMPVTIACQNIDNFDAWQAFIYSPVIAVLWVLFFASLFLHAWVGMRDVIIDYVHSFKLRALLLSLLAIYLVALMFWVLRILLLSTGATT